MRDILRINWFRFGATGIWPGRYRGRNCFDWTLYDQIRLGLTFDWRSTNRVALNEQRVILREIVGDDDGAIVNPETKDWS